MISDVCSTLLSAIACGSVLLAVLSILVLAVFALPKALVRKCAGIAEKLSRIWRIHPAPLSLFILAVLTLAMHVGGKGDRSPLMLSPRAILLPQASTDAGASDPGSSWAVSYGAISYEAFSNLHASAISVTPTNVCLTAAWQPIANGLESLDVYSSTNLRDSVWEQCATVEVNAANTNAVFSLPLDWFGFPPMLFLRLASRFDLDGDGLPDALEKWTFGTDPASPDSDLDGLSDADELRIGTDPLLGDTDGDGLLDGEEDGPAGYVLSTSLFDLEPENKGNLIAGMSSCDDKCFTVTLPFEVTLFNSSATNLVIDSNGLVYLSPAPSFSPRSRYSNDKLPATLAGDAVCMAPFWDDLYAEAGVGEPELNVGWLNTNGVNYAIIEFRDFSFYSASTNDLVSFRLVLADACRNYAWIYYDKAFGLGDGEEAIFGGCQCFAPFVSVNAEELAGNITAGTVLELHLTDGSSPLIADTDGDGLPDGVEVLLGTSPVASDSDGDSLQDGWEYQYGFDPLDGDSPGLAMLDSDMDGDGLSLWEECQYGTSPVDATTFGIPDGDFIDNGMRPLPPDGYVEVPVSIGDPSGSESERWAITVAEQGNSFRQYKVTSDSYGTVKTRNLRLCPGSKYAITVRHVGTNRSSPDYDWEAQIGNLPDALVLPGDSTHPDSTRWFSVSDIGAVVDNRDGLLGVCRSSFGSEDYTKGKTAYLYIPKADLVGYAAMRGNESQEVPEEERFNPGYLVMGTGTADLDAMPAKVKFSKLEDGFALSRYMRFSEAGRMKAKGDYDWAVAGTTDEIAIPGNVDVDAFRKLAINEIADWPDGTTHIDVEYIVRDRDGELLTASTNRLLRPYLIACGNSLTWGLRRCNGVFETALWESPWTAYPGEAEWVARNCPPTNRFLKAYQGYRGYLAEKLPGVTWLGLDTNEHGPPHLGFPGAKASEIKDKIGDHSSLFTKGNCYQVIVYCAGMNDCTSTNTSVSIVNDWRAGVSTNDFLRTNKGRTLFVALKIPELSSVYPNNYERTSQKITAVNASMDFVSANPFFKFVLGDTAQIPHENDDGMHFSDVGYSIMADRIYSAIIEGLGDD